MPKEKRVLEEEQDALKTNWKSAQCVTSLYDSYIQLQGENEQLREEIRRIEQKQLEKSPDDPKIAELEQEIRLLRREKLKKEEIHRLAVQQVEIRAAKSEKQHQELVVKYQERFEFDPLEAKRAAMAVKSMQSTLQNVILEKEELGIRYGELKEKYGKFQKEQADIVQTLKDKVKTLEQHRVRTKQERVMNVLAAWSVNQMRKAWTKWLVLAKAQRLKEENVHVVAILEQKVDVRVSKLQENQAAIYAIKLLQQTARQTFVRWRDWTRSHSKRRRQTNCFRKKYVQKRMQCVLIHWWRVCQEIHARVHAVMKIERVMTCHLRCRNLLKWRMQTFRQVLAEEKRMQSAFSETMDVQTKAIEDLQKALNEERKTTHLLQRHHEEEIAMYHTDIEKHQAAELATRLKLRHYFTKQLYRQILNKVLHQWKIAATCRHVLKQRTRMVTIKLRQSTLRRAVSHWQGSTHHSRKRRAEIQRILQRMRQLEVSKCFESWKESVEREKSRRKALQDIVNTIKNREIAHCFTQWVAFRAQRRRLRKGVTMLAQYVTQYQLYFTFKLWKDRVKELKLQAHVKEQERVQKTWEDRLVDAKVDLNFKRQCFIGWNEVLRHRKRLDMMLKKCVSRLKNGLVTKMLCSWQDFVACRRRQRKFVHRWLGKRHTSVLHQAWLRWQRQSALKEQQLVISRLQKERNAIVKRLEVEFSEYRKSQRKLLEGAEHVQTIHQANLQEANARCQEESKRAKRLAHAVESLCCLRARASVLLRCFKAWKREIGQTIAKRQSVHAMQSARTVRRARKTLSQWKLFIARQQRRAAGVQAIQSWCSRWWQVKCFRVWVEARRRSKALHEFVALVASNFDTQISRKIFTGWRFLARKNGLLRRIVEHFWLGSVRGKMKQRIVHWDAVTKAEAAKATRNEALATICAKIWWKKSVSTMRCCVLEWKHAIRVRKKHKLAAQKLVLLERKRLVMMVFKIWDLATRKQCRNLHLTRWCCKMEQRMQQRAMTRWKMFLLRNQKQDLEEMKRKLTSQSEEIVLLKQSTAETRCKLVNATEIRDASITKLQYLTECGLVAKVFNALKLTISMKRYRTQAVHFFRKNTCRQQLTRLFSKWYLAYQNARAVKMIVAQKAQRCNDVRTCIVLREWLFVATQLSRRRQKQLKLVQRLHGRMIAKTFEGWRRYIDEEIKFRRAMDHFEVVTRKWKLKNTLLTWQQQCIEKRSREALKMVNHEKVMRFVLHRQEKAVARTFRLWKRVLETKQRARFHAQQRYTDKCQRLLFNYWHCWNSSTQQLKLQHKSIECLDVALKRYHFRVAFSHWKRYRFQSEIAALLHEKQELDNQVTTSKNQLQCSSKKLDQLSSDLTILTDKLSETQSHLSTKSLEVTAQEVNCSRQLKSLTSLSRLLLQQMVSRQTLRAFTLWKMKLVDGQQKCQVLANLAKSRQQKTRLMALWLWKIKTLRHRTFESLKTSRRIREQRTMLQCWKNYTKTQVMLRLFLTKRCLLSYSAQRIPLSMAFHRWKTETAGHLAVQQVETLQVKLHGEQEMAILHVRKLSLGKWCWRAYHHRIRQLRAFYSRCALISIQRTAIKYHRALDEMQVTSDAALAKVREQNQEALGALATADEHLTSGASLQALQTLIRRLFQPTSVKDLCMSVSSTFAQLLHGGTATLFLFDPTSNELWTQREENQVIQVPASLGIAGSTLSSGSTLIITDVAADSRFHPMVDQFVLSDLRQDTAIPLSVTAASQPSFQATKTTIGMVSSALVSTDGAVYGILQVAFPTSSLSPIDRRLVVTRTQLYSKTCCSHVEQVVFEMLRNCRDRVHARTPEKFIKLFKQNKNWRKYYASMERKAFDVEAKLRDVLDERKQLMRSKAELEKRHDRVKDKLERSTKDTAQVVVNWKKKLAKWQKVLEEKDRVIQVTTKELERVEQEVEKHRRIAAQGGVATSEGDSSESIDKSKKISERGQLSILRADQTRLKSQLVRAEADNLLLVKAIHIARTQHGELPTTIQTEVTRVATRVSRLAPQQA